MDKQRIIEIANELLVYTGLNAKKLSEAIGKNSAQWFYDILSDRKPNGFSRTISLLVAQKWPEIDSNYLMTGEGSLLKPPPSVSVGGDQNGNINSPGASTSAGIDKLITVVADQSRQIGDLIKTNQDLINIISNLSKQ